MCVVHVCVVCAHVCIASVYIVGICVGVGVCAHAHVCRSYGRLLRIGPLTFHLNP